MVSYRDVAFLRVNIRRILHSSNNRILQVMEKKDRCMAAVAVIIDLRFVPETLEVGLRLPSKMEAKGFFGEDKEMTDRWVRLEEQESHCAGKVLICVRIPMGQNVKIFVGSTEMSDLTSLNLFPES